VLKDLAAWRTPSLYPVYSSVCFDCAMVKNSQERSRATPT
jgi:hypothetical protein